MFFEEWVTSVQEVTRTLCLYCRCKVAQVGVCPHHCVFKQDSKFPSHNLEVTTSQDPWSDPRLWGLLGTMATMTPSPDQSHAASPDAVACSQTTAKPQRVLACLLCQQRKIKCDRKFPCGNCNKASAQCVPAALTPRQRRRRFPERELLERLRRYESLLRENSINFEPLNSSTGGHSSCRQDGKDPGLPGRMKSELPILGDRLGKDQATVKSEPVYEAK